MKLNWYLNRLKKMNPEEVLKRIVEHLEIYFSRLKYQNPNQWPYSRFSPDNVLLKLYPLPGFPVENHWEHYQIYNKEFDLTKPLNWYFSENTDSAWPFCHYSKINYRAGNPHGDVRINWELNRLQFLPAMAVTDEQLAKSTLKEWMIRNPFVYGPSYLASMEVAIRWLSIYRAVCLFKLPLEKSLLRNITGLAVASGKFIESRLSTHSSAGNHLIVEAVGLFWIGKALEETDVGIHWISKARDILQDQVPRQVNPDGSNQEQCIWYLGFVLDALFHYFLLEDSSKIPLEVWNRVEKMLEFIHDMTSPDGTFPDYGDRDDGYIFRISGDYDESPFPGLLSIGALYFNRPEWNRKSRRAKERLAFWMGKDEQDILNDKEEIVRSDSFQQPMIKVYNDGGMTFVKWENGKSLFRHSRLGLGNTCGHGHADALSVLFSWKDVPVLIDLGSGQYNGDQKIRSFFRSTIAHNTVEVGGKDQAKMLGPFMWKKSYGTKLKGTGDVPVVYVEADHDGYFNDFALIHSRKVKWRSSDQIEIHDSFSCPGEVTMRGAFHLGSSCRSLYRKESHIEADFDFFKALFYFPAEIETEMFFGSQKPFFGWRSTVYGEWEPIHAMIFSGIIKGNYHYGITIKITEI